MTQQDVIGEFSWLLSEFRPAPNELLEAAVVSLRHDVENGPLRELPDLARQAMTLADLICAAALESGDADRFSHHIVSASVLEEFLVSASLLP